MSYVVTFCLNAVELCVVTINEKPLTRAREVCRALEYGKTTKADNKTTKADIVKHLCSRENYAHKCQFTEHVSETNFMDWPKDPRKDDYYINEEGIYEFFLKVNSLRQKKLQKVLLQCDVPRNSAATCKQNEPLRRSKDSINRPWRKKIQQLHCLMMIIVSMKTWYCMHKEMSIKMGYKNVKTTSAILGHVM